MNLHEILPIMSSLNAWARDGGPSYAIYWLKGEAIKKAIEARICTHKKVFVTAKCWDCGGSRQYEAWYGKKYDHCWACENTGIVKLRFVETVIQVDEFHQIIWHTPWDRTWNIPHGLQWEGSWGMPGDDWTVNKPGKKLSPVEAAKALNEAEAFFGARPGVCTHYYEDDFCGPIDNFDYSLNLGEKPRICCLCGETRIEEIPHGYCAGKDKLSWTDYACKACDEKAGGDHSIAVFGLFEPPDIAKDVEIRIWQARHMAWFSKGEVRI